MPELPEAETIVRGLRTLILNRKILKIRFPKARFFRPHFEHPVKYYLDSTMVQIFRHGKSVIIQLRTRRGKTEFIVIRLGMTGQLLVGDRVDRHTHAVFQLDEPGRLLCFRDQRQFGRMFFVGDWQPIFFSAKHKAHIAARAKPGSRTASTSRAAEAFRPVSDPLAISTEEFVALLHGRRGMIKAALMSQQFLMGIGNIYADESLFQARLHPQQKLQRLSRTRLAEYFQALLRVLRQAIARGGSSISDFVGANNVLGEFQLDHQVYGRTGEKCLRAGCSGVIKRIVVATRGTHFCPKCQKRI